MDGAAALAALLGRSPGRDGRSATDLLLAEFGSLSAILAASPERLARHVRGREVERIGAMRAVMVAALRGELRRSAPLTSTQAVADYFAATVRHLPVEELHVLFLGRDNAVLRDELVARGSRTQLVFEPRQILRRALELEADGLLLAHNHPDGSRRPSAEDLLATTRLGAMAGPLGIAVVDHVVIGRDSIVSLRAEGLL